MTELSLDRHHIWHYDHDRHCSVLTETTHDIAIMTDMVQLLKKPQTTRDTVIMKDDAQLLTETTHDIIIMTHMDHLLTETNVTL